MRITATHLVVLCNFCNENLKLLLRYEQASRLGLANFVQYNGSEAQQARWQGVGGGGGGVCIGGGVTSGVSI
jgi:hypothetical protein